MNRFAIGFIFFIFAMCFGVQIDTAQAYGRVGVGYPGPGTATGPIICSAAEANAFPFNFLCTRNNNDARPMTLVTTQSSSVLQGTNYIDFTVGFVPNSDARSSPGGPAAGVKLWTTIDMNDDVFNGFSSISGGGDGSYACPGSDTNNKGTTNQIPIVYNFQDDAGIPAGRPNASPAAWVGGPPGGNGYEDCQTEGRMVYWTMGGNFTSNEPVERTFRLNINSVGNRGQQICLRTNVSVSYGGNPWPDPSAPSRNASANDGNTMSRIAKQSDELCFTIVNQDVQGDLTTLNCSGFSLSGLKDPDHLTGGQSNVPISWRIVRQNASGNGYTETVSGTTPARSPGNYFEQIISPPAAGPPGGFVTSTVYKLQIYDPDSQTWVDGTANRGGPSLVRLTTPCDPPQQNCNSLYIKDQDQFDPPPPSSPTVRLYNTRVRIWISDSTGRQLIPQDTRLTNGAAETYNFVPDGQQVTISIIREFQNTSVPGNPWRPYSDDANNLYTDNDASQSAAGSVGTIRGTIRNNCYAATCTIDNVTDAGTGGVVQAGRPYRVSYTMYNPPPPNHLTLTSTLGGHALTMNDGGNPHNVSAGIAPGTSLPGYYDVANAPPADFNVSATPQYFNSFDLGPPCGTPSPVKVYNTFTLTPWPEICTAAGCDDEEPTAVNYRTAVATDRLVNNVPSEGYATLTPNGGATANIASYNAAKNFAVGSPPPVANDTLSGVFPARPVNGGDSYCAVVNLSYSTGLVDSAGNIAPGTTSVPATRNACFTVKNKPYFKVYGSNVAAGGNFASVGSCNGGGDLGGWYRNDGVNPAFIFGRGSTSELSALGLNKIKGVASAQTDSYRSPTELTFANSITSDIDPGQQGDPKLGGKYGTSRCLDNIEKPLSNANAVDWPSANPIGPMTLNAGESRAYYVNGDAYIDGDITYNTSGWGFGTVPSFVLHAKGNIYIKNTVRQLDGLYIAEPTNATTKGQIYTCATGLGNPVSNANMYGSCHRQLTVNGNFIARKVNLMRTYGSVRDEKPSTQGVPGLPIGGRNGVTSQLFWSHSGRPAGYNECAHIYEDAEPAVGVAPTNHGWDDNYLCLDPADDARVDIGWSHGGSDPVPVLPSCEFFTLAATAGDPYTWNDNQVCSNANIRFVIAPGNPATSTELCTQMYEPWDTDIAAWQQNGIVKAYACIATYDPGGGTTADTLPLPTSPLACSNRINGGVDGRGTTTRNTCAAEVFDFSPEFYLSKPAINGTSNNAPTFDAITSLPPIL